FGWVDEGNAAYYPNGKRAGDLTGVLHLRADKLTDRGSRRCFRAVGEVELCFDRTAVNEARTE
ncbi:MAG: hypothetical protein JNK04_09135, partial [Myxococcales bacterium]|nr:hypothetical protein [Myxococcales bacterium]